MSIAPRRSRSLHSLTAAALLLTTLQGSPAIAQESAAEAMARAIARMMESMGFADSGPVGGAVPPPPPYDPAMMPGWPSAFDPLGSADGARDQAGTAASAATGRMADMLQQWTQGQGAAQPWGGSLLAGVWEDNQGGVLIVQGSLYRLYSSCDGYIEGGIRVTADRIELTNRRQGFSQTFEYALDQGRLALRSTSGQVFLYRRLVLGRPR